MLYIQLQFFWLFYASGDGSKVCQTSETNICSIITAVMKGSMHRGFVKNKIKIPLEKTELYLYSH